jgi:hypothetical protein
MLVLAHLGMRPVLEHDLAVQSPALLIEEFYKLDGDFGNPRNFRPPVKSAIHKMPVAS